MPADFDLSIEVLQGSWLCSIPPDLVSVVVCGELARLRGELVRLKVLADGSLQAGEWVASEESTAEEVLWLHGEEICYWRRQEEADAACERVAVRIQRRWRAVHAAGRRAELQRQLQRRATGDSVLRALLALQDLWRSAGPPLPYFFASAGESEDMDNVEPRLLASVVEQAASATAQAASPRASAGAALLLCSLQHGHLTAAELLLLARAPADAVSARGGSALHWACRAGSLGLAQYLLRHRADLHAGMGNGATALHTAGAGGCAALLRLLMARGLAADVAMHNGTTALHLAASGGHAAATQVLVLAQGGAGAAPALELAATRGHTAVVATLLEAGTALDGASTHGISALQGACDGGHEAVVELLLQRGACLGGPSALRAASAKGHVEVVRLLLQRGASAHAENALLTASVLGHAAVAELLRGCGAALQDPDPKALVRALVDGRVLLHQDGPESAALETACDSCQVELDAALESTCKGRQEELLGVLLRVPAPRVQAGSLDGDWLDGTGQEAAAIHDDTILWRGGFASVLSTGSNGSFSTSLEGWGELRAISGPERRLIWSDGDVWQRRPACAPSGSKGNRRPGAILLARHGERLDDFLWANNGELWIPSAERPWDPPLTARGRLQALSLGYRVQRLVEQLGVALPSRVFSSPFVRCFETAALAARVVGVGKVCIEPSLCEGLCEEFWRSWAAPGADGSWGGPEGCGLGVPVASSKLRPEARGTVAALVPPERLQVPWGAAADRDYEPLMTLAELDYTWGHWEPDAALEARMRSFYEHVAKLGETVMLVSHAGPSQALMRAVGAPQAPCGYCCLHVLKPLGAPVAQRQQPRPAMGRSRAVGMAMELFECFDKDEDGFWNLREASQLIMATLGIKLPPRTFLSLKAAVADKEGDKLGHEEVVKGLSREDVVLLYTEPQLKRFFGAVMELRRDHAAVFPARG